MCKMQTTTTFAKFSAIAFQIIQIEFKVSKRGAPNFSFAQGTGIHYIYSFAVTTTATRLHNIKKKIEIQQATTKLCFLNSRFVYILLCMHVHVRFGHKF